MTIRHLTIFVAVADLGSMSAAAASLYLSQPTVSQAIRELEKHYNGLLFERLGKKLYLTERGQLLLPQARNLIRQFQQLEELMLNQGQSSTLKLGSTITVGTCLTPFLIPRLQKNCPEIRVHSYVSNTKDIEQKLLRSELDVGIVEGEILSPDLTVLPIIDDCLVLAVGKDHPFYGKKRIQVQDLVGEPFAMREQGSGTRQLFEEYAAEAFARFIRLCVRLPAEARRKRSEARCINMRECIWRLWKKRRKTMMSFCGFWRRRSFAL